MSQGRSTAETYVEQYAAATSAAAAPATPVDVVPRELIQLVQLWHKEPFTTCTQRLGRRELSRQPARRPTARLKLGNAKERENQGRTNTNPVDPRPMQPAPTAPTSAPTAGPAAEAKPAQAVYVEAAPMAAQAAAGVVPQPEGAPMMAVPGGAGRGRAGAKPAKGAGVPRTRRRRCVSACSPRLLPARLFRRRPASPPRASAHGLRSALHAPANRSRSELCILQRRS